MSIIQSIREKAAWLVFGIIALSLLGFLLMDAFVGRSGQNMFSGDKTTIGSVNGNKVEYIDFQQKVKQAEEQYTAKGYPMNEQMRNNVQEQVWNQYIAEALLDEEADKAGVTVTPKELDDILFGANPPQDMRQQFTDPKTGEYDVNGAKTAIANLRKQKNNPIVDNFNNSYLPGLLKGRLREKYASLMGNSTYFPKWLLEKTNADNSELAAISYVNVPYSTISDSAIAVSDNDVNNYVSKHADEFKQQASKSISYVVFNASPTSKDSVAQFEQIASLKNEFTTTPDVNGFLMRNGSSTNFYDGYVVKSKMQMPNADTIRSLADGEVFGPYLDGGSYAVAKMIGKRSIPDSVKSRHILISTQTTPDTTAKVRMDSIAAAIKGGANFALLCLIYSEDPGSKEKGGEYEFGSQQFGNLAKEFAETIFYGTAGDKKVVKTSFGYHYIEVLSQKNFETGYKVAYLSKPISASEETENTASGLANQFAGESRDAKSFDANVTKRNYQKLIGTDIKPNDDMIQGLGSSRSLVKWINEADKGDVSETFNIDDKYVVSLVTENNKEGLMSAAKARPQVEFIIRNQLKAEKIKAKIGKPASLEAVATANGLQVLNADSVNFASPFIPNVGQEQKVIGASFSKELKGKVSEPIAGNGGVFVIKVNNVSAQPGNATSLEQQRLAMGQQAKSMGAYKSIEVLKKAADIKDNRARFF